MSFDWNGFDAVLTEKAPEILRQLRPPAKAEDLTAARQATGLELPAELISAYLAHDGQDRQWRSYFHLFGMYRWNSIADLVDSYLQKTDLVKQALSRGTELEVLVQDESTLEPDQLVRADLWNPAWIPFAWDPAGAALLLDMAPGPAGQKGQVVAWDAVDRARPKPIASSLDVLVDSLANALREGRLTCGPNNDFPGWTEASSGEAMYLFPCQR
jgi:cell wall assembly regulator SMI1